MRLCKRIFPSLHFIFRHFHGELFLPKKFPIRFKWEMLRDVKPLIPLLLLLLPLRLTLWTDFSLLPLPCATDIDFCERGTDFMLSPSHSDKLEFILTGLVVIQMLTANNNSDFNASHGVSLKEKLMEKELNAHVCKHGV